MENFNASKDSRTLQDYVNIIEDLNRKEKCSYNYLIKNLLENFGLRISLSEIRELYEPNLEELKRDLEIQIKNVC
jgi:hypothetical protein